MIINNLQNILKIMSNMLKKNNNNFHFWDIGNILIIELKIKNFKKHSSKINKLFLIEIILFNILIINFMMGINYL